MTKPTPTPANERHPMKHATACTSDRDLDVVEHATVTTYHCVDCGAHQAVTSDGVELPEPAVTGALSGARPDHSDLLRAVPRGDR